MKSIKFASALASEKVGTRTWHQNEEIVENDSEVVEKFGGPCRGRTCGPLIKSSDPSQTEPTQDDLSEGKTEDQDKL